MAMSSRRGSGRSPFSAEDPEAIFIQILEAEIYYPRSLSPQARDLLEHLLGGRGRIDLDAIEVTADQDEPHGRSVAVEVRMAHASVSIRRSIRP